MLTCIHARACMHLCMYTFKCACMYLCMQEASTVQTSSALRLRGGSSQGAAVQESVPVYLMMPLDTVVSNTLQLNETIPDLLKGAKEVGATGIMFDLWWGLCEQTPNEYRFDGYIDLMQRCKALGLKVQAVMSFHACGGNVGDSVNVPLPQWVLDLEDSVPELFYRDQRGDASKEYISLSCDKKSVFPRGVSNKNKMAGGEKKKKTLYRGRLILWSTNISPTST